MKKNNYKQWELKKRLTLVIFAAVFSVLILSSTLFIIANYFFSNKNFEENAFDITRSVASRIEAAIVFDDAVTIKETFDQLLLRTDIRQVNVYLDDRYLYVSKGETNPPIYFNEAELCHANSLFSKVLSICHSVTVEGKIIAHTYLVFTRDKLFKRQYTQIYILIVSIMISLLLSLIFASRVSDTLTSPLHKLAVLADKVAKEKRFNLRGKVYGTQEVRLLTESFNQMLDEIETKDDELLKYTQNLEQAVEERTNSLNHALEQATQANAVKSAFLANMSHELRTPLHGILSFARFGIKNYTTAPPDKLLRYFDRINTSGERLHVLLNDLLDLSKLEAGQMELDKQTTSLREIAINCVAEQDALLLEKKLTLFWDTEKCDTNASFDRSRIAQVIANLLSNAIKFTEEGKSIHISFALTHYQNQAAIKMSIQDQGIGIHEEELALVFDQFVQSSKTKTDAGGTGLGLAICKEIIALHNGKIWAESVVGGGTKFSFLLPV
ncbi:MAG: HAMP domain-containing protein [Methylococcales bacterium]|nr:HAMP domain-containing protein [Methylococcales bacterium]